MLEEDISSPSILEKYITKENPRGIKSQVCKHNLSTKSMDATSILGNRALYKSNQSDDGKNHVDHIVEILI